MAMLDWNAYRQHLTVRIGEIAKLSPDTIKGYQALTAAGQKTNLLGPKTRELISLAVAVTVRCDGCITVHTEAAARHGASREEIAEALGHRDRRQCRCRPRLFRPRAGRLRRGDRCVIVLYGPLG
jgi:AhpD family alkylhydroperoxidase